MTFKTNDKNQLLIFGKTIDEYKKAFGNLNSSISDGSIKNKISGKISTWWNGDTSKLIPNSKLIPEISFEEAEKEIQAFNEAMSKSGTTVSSYFADLKKGNSHFKKFIQNTSDADRTAVNYQKSVKAAREEQLAQNAAVKQSGAAYKAAAIGMKACQLQAICYCLWL
ncbi:MAG: hypothetical protein LIO87_06815 [Eubacterium sp.]|nr:hypothetical protein [Eubacterium sp.]MCC8161224.1 hypothetical protein [Oscillospiraceae bacterium]